MATITLLAARVALDLLRTGPLVVSDETGYLTNARVLWGGTSGALVSASFTHGGYSVLVAPLLKITDDPTATYRLVLVLNAVLAAALLPLLYLLLIRSFRARPSVAFWAALAASVYPSVTIFSQVALSENLLLPLGVAWLLCFGELLDASTARKRVLFALLFGAVATALYATHGRMITAFALTPAALLLLMLRRRLALPPALLGVAVTVIGLAGVRLLDAYLVTHNYGGHSPNEVGSRFSNLRGLHGILAVARNLVGESWYLIVASLGLLAVAVVTSRESGGGRFRTARASTPSLVLALLVAAGGALLVVSALSFPDLERADTLIYGRYNEVLVPPLLAIALVRLHAVRWARSLAVVLPLIGVLTLVVVALRVGAHPSRGPNRWNVAGLPFLTLTLGPISLIGAGIVASVVVTALAVVGRRRPAAVAPMLVLLFLPTTAVVEHNPVLSGQRSFYPAGWSNPDAVLAGVQTVAYDMDRYDVVGRYVYPWFTPHARFVEFSGSTEAPPSRFVISSRDWGSRHPRLAARRRWVDPARNQAIFELKATR